MSRKGLLRSISAMLLCSILFVSGCGTSSDDAGNEPKNKVETIALERTDGAGENELNLSDEDYEECSNCIDDIYKKVGEYDNRGYSEEGDVKAAVEAVSSLAEEWKEKGTVSEIKRHDSYVHIEFASGIKYFFSPSTPGTSAVGSNTQVSVYSLQPAKTEFAERNTETQTADTNATDVSAKKIDDAYENYSWKYDLDDKEVTFQTVADFAPNDVILWNGHGGYFEECGSVLVLSETIDDVRYKGDNLYYIVNDGNYLITSFFVDTYVGDISNTFLYLSTCSGLRDTGLVDSFKNKGAAAIVANTDVITTIYTSNVMASVVDSMVEGSMLDEAMDVAKAQYGEQDSLLYEEYGALGYAVPTVYCGGDYTFAETGFVDGEYQTNKTDNQSGYCDNIIMADADGNRTSAPGFYEAYIQDGYLHINGGIALHSWEPRSHIVNFYPYSEYIIELADSCYYEETFVGEIPAEERTIDEMDFLLQQAQSLDMITMEISDGVIVKLSFSGYEF
ncbi:MAG: hypothetical protein E7222_10450 [Clostridiales bacterium]|nr:hypothetical protein [Clostridiales bacterium]